MKNIYNYTGLPALIAGLLFLVNTIALSHGYTVAILNTMYAPEDTQLMVSGLATLALFATSWVHLDPLKLYAIEDTSAQNK